MWVLAWFANSVGVIFLVKVVELRHAALEEVDHFGNSFNPLFAPVLLWSWKRQRWRGHGTATGTLNSFVFANIGKEAGDGAIVESSGEVVVVS